MRRWLLGTAGICLLIALYLMFYPTGADPVFWRPPRAPELVGKYAENELLSPLEILFPGSCPQCEDVDVDPAGRIYGGGSGGEIFRFDPVLGRSEVFAETGGRPLGLDFDPTGNLVVADAQKGLLRIDTTGNVETLVSAYDSVPFRFANDLEIAGDGVIYFSETSTKYGLETYKLDLLEHRPTGRVFAYDPENSVTTLLLDDLYFANGVAVSHDQSFLLICETGAYRVRRYWLKGERKGTSDVFIQNLPGFPDGISQGEEGVFWLALVSPRDPRVDRLMEKPDKRKVLARLPDFLLPAPKRFAFVLGLDREAHVVYNLQDPTPEFAQITSVQEVDGWLYLGSLSEAGIGKVYKPDNQVLDAGY